MSALGAKLRRGVEHAGAGPALPPRERRFSAWPWPCWSPARACSRRLTRLVAVLPVITPPFVIGLGHHPDLRPLRRHQRAARAVARPAAHALDLRPARRAPRPALRVHAGGVPRADRRRRGREPDAGGGRADARRPRGPGDRAPCRCRSWRPGWPTRSWSASSRASPTSAIPWCWAATSACSPPRSTSRWSARSTIRGRAAALAIILLALALGAFLVQQRVLAGRAFTTVTGKGDAGIPWRCLARSSGPSWRWPRRGCSSPCSSTAWRWWAASCPCGVAITRSRSRHFAKAFARGVDARPGCSGRGGAWTSLWNTLRLAAAAAPLSAAVGLLTAYLLDRVRFAGPARLRAGDPAELRGAGHGHRRRLRPGASTSPPFELTGGGLIIVLCLVFRNMPVGVRARPGHAPPDRSVARRGLEHAGRGRGDDGPARAAAADQTRRGRQRSSTPSSGPSRQ